MPLIVNNRRNDFCHIKIKYSIVLFVTFLLSSSYETNGQNFIVDADFPGGNIIVNDTKTTSSLYFTLQEDTVWVRPDLRDTKRDWFYWYFRVSEAGNKTLHFIFPGNHVGPFGPAFSIDGGKNWQWLYDRVSTESKHFQYTFGKDVKEVRFSSIIPYLQSDFDNFISSLQDSPLIKVEPLTTSEKGRNIKKIIIQNTETINKYKVSLTARHHACETMANYVLEGIIESVLHGDGNSMKWLRENVAFFIVPFIDIDGVEDGDQGKSRIPWDHNVDYNGESIYKSTTAIRQQLPEWAQNNLNMVLDLHCPGLRGEWAETIYIVGAKDQELAIKQKAFLEVLKEENHGILKLHPTKSIIEYGTGWNVPNEKESERKGFREWTSELGGIPYFASTIKIPYANNNGQMVLPQNARLFGKDIANAIATYLQNFESR